MDYIDVTVCKVFEIDTKFLWDKTRNGRAVMARFAVMYIRYQQGLTHEQIAQMYGKTRPCITQAIRKTKNFLEYDKHFRLAFNQIRALVEQEVIPYTPDNLCQGVKVRTRQNSKGESVEGTVTSITNERFVVECFDDATYRSVNRVSDGRVSSEFETSRDILFIAW